LLAMLDSGGEEYEVRIPAPRGAAKQRTNRRNAAPRKMGLRRQTASAGQ